MEKIENTVMYYCDIIGCNEKSWLGKEFDWKMCEIVFGIHPTIVEKISKKTGKSVEVIQKKFNFCRSHLSIKEDLFYFIADEFPDPVEEKICTLPFLKDGLGCWITIHDCLTHEPIKNFQLPYAEFANIFRRFTSLLNRTHPLKIAKVNNIKRLSCQARL